MAFSSFFSWIVFMNFILSTNAISNSCSPGQYCFPSGVTPTNYPCPIGTYGYNLPVNQPCPVCPSGTYTNTVGQSSCSSCQSGGYSSLRIMTGNSTSSNIVTGNNTGLIVVSGFITGTITGYGAIIQTGTIVNTGVTVTGVVNDNPAQSYLNQNTASITNTITNDGGALITIVADSTITISATSDKSITVNIVSNGNNIGSGTTTYNNGGYNSISGTVYGNGQTNNMITTTITITGPITSTAKVTLTGVITGNLIVTVAGPDVCFPCQPGTYSNSGDGYCKTCPAGSYSGVGFGFCTTCPPGTSSTPGSAKCVLPPLTTSNQFNLCVAGSIRPICAYTSNLQNQGLVPIGTDFSQFGQFIFNFTMANFPPQSNFGSITTIPTITPLVFTNNNQCILFYVLNNGDPGVDPKSTARSLCFQIALPYQLGNNFLVSVGNLLGTFGYLVSVNNVLNVVLINDPSTSSFPGIYIQCYPGYGMSVSNINCQQCISGTYSPSFSGQSACMICPAGSYCDGIGLTTYISCPSGTYSTDGAVSCSANCPYGYYPGPNQACLTVVGLQSSATSTINQFYICGDKGGGLYCLREPSGQNYVYPSFQDSSSLWTLYSSINNLLVPLSNPTWFACMYGIWSSSNTQVRIIDHNGNYCGSAYSQWTLEPYNTKLIIRNNYNGAYIQLTSGNTFYCGTPPCVNVEPSGMGSDTLAFLQCQPGYGAVLIGTSYQCQVCPVGTYWLKEESFCHQCASATTPGSVSCADTTAITSIFCSPNQICQGSINGMPNCYGSTGGCLWGQNDCKTNKDCSKYNSGSPSYTDHYTCNQLGLNAAGNVYWGYSSCPIAQPLTNLMCTSGFCQQLNNGVPTCYGSSGGCLWYSDCTTNDDCLKYNTASASYSNQQTCSQLITNNVPSSYWGFLSCGVQSQITCSHNKFCQGLNSQNMPTCYGKSGGCLWNTNDCNVDSYCLKYSSLSPQYTDGKTCDQFLTDSTGVGSDYWALSSCSCRNPTSFQLCTDSTKKNCVTSNLITPPSSPDYTWTRWSNGDAGTCFITKNQNSITRQATIAMEINNNWIVGAWYNAIILTTNPGYYGWNSPYLWNFQGINTFLGITKSENNQQFIINGVGNQWDGLPIQITSLQQCAANYNNGQSNSPSCCGQSGGTITNSQYICPASSPTCVNYIVGNQWGTCTQHCSASYNGGKSPAPTCCDQPDTITSDSQYICPASAPICVNYITGYQWGICTSERGIAETPAIYVPICGPGYYWDNIVITCVQKIVSSITCQPGYGFFVSSGSCQQCVPGTYYVKSESTCQFCPDNTYSNIYGAISCVTCPYGTSSSLGNPCTYCPGGTIPLVPNGCRFSPANTTAMGMQKALASNTAGTSINPGSEVSQPITTPGLYSCLAATVASPCSAGTFYIDPSNPNACLPCPAGSYCPYPGTDILSVIPCPANTFSGNGSIACSSSCTPPDSYTCAYVYNNQPQWCPGGSLCVYPSSSSSSPAFINTPGGIAVTTIGISAGLGTIAYTANVLRVVYILRSASSISYSDAFPQAINIIRSGRLENTDNLVIVRGARVAPEQIPRANIITQTQVRSAAQQRAEAAFARKEAQRTQTEANARNAENPQLERQAAGNEERVVVEEEIQVERAQGQSSFNDIEAVTAENEIVDEGAVAAASDGISIPSAGAADAAQLATVAESGWNAAAMSDVVGSMGEASVGSEVGDVPGIVFVGFE
jgi:hypothetical protein